MGTHPHQNPTCGTSIPRGVLPEVHPILTRLILEAHLTLVGSHLRCAHPDRNRTNGVSIPTWVRARCVSHPHMCATLVDPCIHISYVSTRCVSHPHGAPTRGLIHPNKGSTRGVSVPIVVLKEGTDGHTWYRGYREHRRHRGYRGHRGKTGCREYRWHRGYNWYTGYRGHIWHRGHREWKGVQWGTEGTACMHMPGFRLDPIGLKVTWGVAMGGEMGKLEG